MKLLDVQIVKDLFCVDKSSSWVNFENFFGCARATVKLRTREQIRFVSACVINSLNRELITNN